MKDHDGVQFLQWCLPRLRLRWPGFRKVRGWVYKCIDRRLGQLGLADVSEDRRYLGDRTPGHDVLERAVRQSAGHFLKGVPESPLHHHAPQVTVAYGTDQLAGPV